MNWSALLFSAEGRLAQKPYWLSVAALSVFGVLIHFFPLIGGALWVVSVYCWICVYSKRLHDIGRTGWWQLTPWLLSGLFLVFGGLAFIGSLLGALIIGLFSQHPGLGLGVMAGGLGAGFGLLALSAGAHLLFLLGLGLIRSQPGANRFGPEPGVVPELNAETP